MLVSVTGYELNTVSVRYRDSVNVFAGCDSVEVIPYELSTVEAGSVVVM